MTKKEKLTRRIVVDEYGALAAELAPVKIKQSRLDELAKTIRSWFIDEDPETGHTETGDAYLAMLGPKGVETTVDVAAAYDALGKTQFLSVAKLSLTALKDVAPATLATISTKARTGSRSLNAQLLS